jgi:hypothetical protein
MLRLFIGKKCRIDRGAGFAETFSLRHLGMTVPMDVAE